MMFRVMFRRPPLLGLLLLAPLAGCGFPPAESPSERAASDACREDANRTFNAQNRALLSERASPDTPFSGSSLPPLPSDGLSDQYGYDQMVDTCLKRSSAVPVAGQPN